MTSRKVGRGAAGAKRHPWRGQVAEVDRRENAISTVGEVFPRRICRRVVLREDPLEPAVRHWHPGLGFWGRRMSVGGEDLHTPLPPGTLLRRELVRTGASRYLSL